MEKKRDAKGKFAPKAKKPENPDCEPATKGYVKCIARGLTINSYHSHRLEGELRESLTLISGLAVFGSGLVWALIGSLLADPNTVSQMNNIWFAKLALEMAQSLFGGSLVVFIASFTTPNVEDTHDAYATKGPLKAIQKYEPPTCDKKRDECE